MYTILLKRVDFEEGDEELRRGVLGYGKNWWWEDSLMIKLNSKSQQIVNCDGKNRLKVN